MLRMLSPNDKFSRLSLTNKTMYDMVYTISDLEISLIWWLFDNVNLMNDFELRKQKYDMVVIYERSIINLIKIIKLFYNSNKSNTIIAKYSNKISKFNDIIWLMEDYNLKDLENYLELIINIINELSIDINNHDNNRLLQNTINSLLYIILMILYMKKIYIYYWEFWIIKMSTEQIEDWKQFIKSIVNKIDVSCLNDINLIERDAISYVYDMLSWKNIWLNFIINNYRTWLDKSSLQEYFELNAKKYFRPWIPLWFNLYKILHLVNSL
jgi:hypothetical protein